MLELNAKKLIQKNHKEFCIWQEQRVKSYEALKVAVLPEILKDVVKELEAKSSKGQGVWTHKEVPEELLNITTKELHTFITVRDGYLSVKKAPNKKGYLEFELSESEFY